MGSLKSSIVHAVNRCSCQFFPKTLQTFNLLCVFSSPGKEVVPQLLFLKPLPLSSQLNGVGLKNVTNGDFLVDIHLLNLNTDQNYFRNVEVRVS